MLKIYYTLLFAGLITASCVESSDKEETVVDEIVSVDYRAKGDSLTEMAQRLLLKNVQSAMKSGGPVHAIEFCNIHAVPLMDTLSREHGARVSRISVDFRNPDNAPNNDERKLLMEMAQEDKTDTLIAASNTYYKTIKIFSTACLKCHGSTDTDIAPKTLTTIRELYPADNAVGYSLGSFRGAWRVEF